MRGRRASTIRSGACMLIRATAWEDVGPLDEGYFMYLEEIDWCRRARLRGWQIWHHPAAVAIHHGGSSTRQQPDAMFAQLWRSRLRYYQRFRGPGFNRVLHRGGAPRLAPRCSRNRPPRPTTRGVNHSRRDAVIARDEERMLRRLPAVACVRRRAPGAGRHGARATARARSPARCGARVEERAFDTFAAQRDAALGLATAIGSCSWTPTNA